MGVDVSRALDGALVDLLAALRDESGSAADADSLAAMLAGHALVESVRGCAVCLIAGEQIGRASCRERVSYHV